MSSKLFKNFIKKAVSDKVLTTYLSKQGPPGPPPRPGLKWKPQTHRWIIDQSARQHGEGWPSDHPVHDNPDKPYLTSDQTGIGFDLHEGQEVTYEVYPTGQNIPGVVRHDDEEGWIIEATGEWKQHFDDQQVSDHIKLGGDEGIGVSTNLSEFKQVQEDVGDIQDFIDSGERHNWQGDALLDSFQDRLDAVGEKIGYNSYETTQAGGQGETELEALLDQLNGALESQQAFGGPQAGSWSDLKADVGNYISVNTPSDPKDWSGDNTDEFLWAPDADEEQDGPERDDMSPAGGGIYSPELGEQKKPELQRLMNERVGAFIDELQDQTGGGLDFKDEADLSDIYTDVYNELYLEEVGNEVGLGDPSETDEKTQEHFDNLGDEITGIAVDKYIEEYNAADEEDYSVDFNIDDHKEAIHGYVKTRMDEYLQDNEEQYEHLEPTEIKTKILDRIIQGEPESGREDLLEDLDIVVPNDEKALDDAMMAIHETVKGSVEHHWEMGRGL